MWVDEKTGTTIFDNFIYLCISKRRRQLQILIFDMERKEKEKVKEKVGEKVKEKGEGKEDEREEEKKKICCICMEREVDSIIRPCLHDSFCCECITKVDKCPICRAEIRGCIKL